MPLISVCLATYNGERYLAQQLQSVLDQSFRDLEIVVSDDGSTDRTRDILNEFAARDPRIRILPPGPRLGMQKNFERAITASTAQYIAPCDQDDFWLPEKLAALYAHLQEKSVALVYCDSAYIDEDDQPLDSSLLAERFKIEGHDPFMFAFFNCVSGHAMLFDRSLLSHALPFPDDPFYDWWIGAVAAATGGIAALDRPLVNYRQHETSITADLRANESIQTDRFFRPCIEDAKRLAAFARLPGEAGSAYRRLSELWPQRTRNYFLPRLSLLLLRHPGVFAARRSSALRTAWRCLKRGIGLPLQHPRLARKFYKEYWLARGEG